MRIFEIILIGIGTLIPFLSSLGIFDKRKGLICSFVIGLLLLHLLFEGYRWQMFPAYLMLFISCVIILRQWKIMSKRKRSIIYIFSFSLFLIFPSWFLPSVLPVFELSTPTGNYQIGSKNILIESTIPEIITNKDHENRKLMVKVWYPASIENEKKEPYLDKGNRNGFSKKYNLPEFTTNHLDYVKTNTFENPQMADGNFPILIFSHGLYSEANGYYSIIEEIVSHGFIVLNINHTYESTGSLFPNGEVLFFNKEFDQKNNNAQMAEMAWNASQNYAKAKNDIERLNATEYLIKNYAGAEITKRWSKDITIILNELDKWENDSFWSKGADFSKIGAFGHSQGGSAIGQVLLEDNKIIAGINIDGAQWGNLLDTTFNKPFLWISSDWPKEHMNINKFSYRNLPDKTFNKHIVKNSGHSNFMDIPLMVNLSFINEAGSIKPHEAYRETTKLIVDFFNKNLNKD
ncbi:MAG: hypothetical protein R6V16_10645 [Bacteroidales bacterium]